MPQGLGVPLGIMAAAIVCALLSLLNLSPKGRQRGLEVLFSLPRRDSFSSIGWRLQVAALLLGLAAWVAFLATG